MKKDLRMTIEDFVTLAHLIGAASQNWDDVKNDKHDQLTPHINLYSAEFKATQALTFGIYPLQFEVKLYSNDQVLFNPSNIEDLPDLLEICFIEWHSLVRSKAFHSKMQAKKNA